jgi:hypothetical protein
MNWVFTLIADQNIRGLHIAVDHSAVVLEFNRDITTRGESIGDGFG